MWLLLGSKIHTSCVFLLIFATHLEQVLTKNVWSTVNNSWGPWEGATACTRTCGGGVERQTRACLTGRRSNKECIGPNSRFQLCNIQNCPEGSRDFKAEQCAKYNQVAFQTHEEWIPYYGNNLDVCALFCSRRNETDRYYKLANRVIDGTPCSLDTYDVCIHGICQPTGCDRILGSGVKEDKCRECGGDGTNCETVEGEIHYDHSNIKKGYNDMLSIPIGAMHIFIKELRPSANHIALRNELGNFYLNGAGKNERSKSFSAAGTVFRYIGNPGNNKELENLNAVGPTNESLVLVLNHKDEDLEIQYEYSKKREVSPLTEPEEPFEETPIHAPILSVKLPGKQGFAWISGSWTSCSKTCGEGFKKRAVQCFDVTRNIKADGSFCSSSSRPESTLPCTNNACEGNYRWRRGEWSACSKTCGGGEQIQTVYCEEISADGKAASIVEKYLCLRSLGKDPQYKRVCMEDIPCGEWAADPWSQTGCHSRRFGCCPDGVTAAQGPNFSGCLDRQTCKNTRFGCCPDGQSTAHGPDDEGCYYNCALSTHKCCPDGVTFAKGPNYEGCGFSDGDVCKQPQDQSFCTDYVMKWFYNSSSKTCSQYWDGGCRSSGNKFKTEEECISACRGGCSGEKDGGRVCGEYALKWWYDSSSRTCKQFWYGGCGGNKNKYNSEQECLAECQVGSGCEYSTYGCCPDGITAAGDTNKRNCAYVKSCRDSRYGCCPDKVSEAAGPNYYGCTCKDSLYGCCQDGITPAQGPGKYGCPNLPCEQSTYSCCPDGVTHARGPNYHGCERGCRHSTYGCCADDITPARGHNYEGCPGQGCQRSTYGCCPDGVTHARGPNYHGCERGCRHSTYGCCEDDITPARGHNYEGCPGQGCQRSTYGCCPDGVTHAEGPNYHGCYEQNCRISTYGCCADSVTSARGPNYEGCPEYRCQESTYGCCPDGVTHAEGPNYHGCYERNCRHSTYGCCADDITPARGPNYEGCLPNGCQGSTYGCCPDGVTYAQGLNYYGCYDQGDCTSLKDSGSCDDYEIRWFYDYNLGKCEQFWYGGCTGNSNNYKTVRDCQIACQGQGRRPGIPKTTALLPVLITNNFKEPAVCTMDKSYGTCASELTRWFFDSKQQICLPFTYSGCNGNANNFASKDACVRKCVTTPVVPSANSISADVCHLQNETGPCHQNIKAWFYDRADGVCKQFIYGGCSGNANNFNTEEECYQICNRQDICSMKEHSGSCLGYKPVFYYSPIKKNCVEFIYGGCGGNANNFDTREACLKKCGFMPYFKGGRRFSSATVQLSSNQSICKLSKEPGTCGQQIVVWYFDYKNGACRRFHYTGCNGNKNRFKKKRDCLLACKGKKHDENMVKSTGSALVLGASRPSLDNRVLNPEETSKYKVLLAEPGKHIIMECGNKPFRSKPNIVWYHGNFIIEPGKRFSIHRDGSLEIHSITDEDSGAYFCKKVGDEVKPPVKQYFVQVKVPLTISSPAKIIVKPGENAFLPCQAQGKPQPQVYWTRNNHPVVSSNQYKLFPNGTLIIVNVQPQDQGDYVCVAQNRHSEPAKATLRLLTRDSVIVKIDRHSGYYKEGSTLTLKCFGYGYPVPSLNWLKDGKPLSTGAHIQVQGGLLNVRNVTYDDGGVYTCVASNDDDKAERDTTIHVELKFDEPRECKDKDAIKCRTIVEASLCRHNLFRKHCCVSCKKSNLT